MNKRNIFIGIIILVVLTIVLAIPTLYDTDDTYAKIANQYGDDFARRGTAEACENDTDGLGVRAVPFGVIATACHDEWFVLFNTFPIHTMDAGDSSDRAKPKASEEPLVKLLYSGGMLIDEERATSWKAIYRDGRVVKATRGGVTAELAAITPSQVAELRELINAPDFVEAGFPKKDQKFCDSYVDGIDTEIQLTRGDGTVVNYSDCDYDLSGDYLHLLTLVNFLTHQATE